MGDCIGVGWLWVLVWVIYRMGGFCGGFIGCCWLLCSCGLLGFIVGWVWQWFRWGVFGWLGLIMVLNVFGVVWVCCMGYIVCLFNVGVCLD